MFAAFGEIVFELLGSPDSLESARRWHYAEHRVIEDVARLQWVGDELETMTIAMLFHASYTDPAAQSAALLAAAADHGARGGGRQSDCDRRAGGTEGIAPGRRDQLRCAAATGLHSDRDRACGSRGSHRPDSLFGTVRHRKHAGGTCARV